MERAWIFCLWIFVVVFCPSVSAIQLSSVDYSVAKRLDALETQQIQSENEIYELRQLTAQQQSVIHRQGTMLRELRQQNDELTARIASNDDAIQKQVETLNAALSVQEKRIWVLENKLDKEMTENEGMHAPVLDTFHKNHTTSGNSIPSVRAPSTQYKKPNRISKRQAFGVAFSVYLNHDMNTEPGTIIRFNKVITNEGNAFSIHSGVFMCPENGLYLLSFAVGQRDAGELYAKLMVNSVNIIDAVVQGYHATQDLQGGNTVVIRLNTGDAVWVEGSTHNHVEGSENRITSFTGVYLHE